MHDSSWPSTAKSTPAAWRHVATARATFWLRGSNAAAQPTQYRTSRSSSPPSAAAIRDGRHLERQRLRPVHPRRCRLAPRVALPLHRSEGGRQLLREARLLEDEIPPEPDDLVDVLDQHRAGLDAGAARDAIPDGIERDRVIDDRLCHRLGRRVGVVEPVGLAHDRRVRDQVDAVLGFDRHIPDAHDEGLRVERLPGIPGGTGLLAPPALRAGEAIEEVLPAQVLERLHVHRVRSLPGGVPGL